MSEVAILMGTQIAVNIARDSSVATALFNANPGYDIEDGAIGKGNIDNTPGGVSEWNNNTMARGAMKPRDPRDSVSQMNLWQMTLQQMRNRKGDSGNLLQGGQPGNIKSGKHYSMSLNNVLTRNGYRVRMLDTAWQRLATQDVSMFQQFVRFNANHLSRNYEIAHELEFLTEIDIAERIREFRYDISIDSKSDMPATIEEKNQSILIPL